MLSSLERKKPARKLNFHKRAWAFTSNEFVAMKRLRRIIHVSVIKSKFDAEISEQHSFIAGAALQIYQNRFHPQNSDQTTN